jgi:hypothetical protein
MLHVMLQFVLLLACIDYHNKICGKYNLLHCSIMMPDQSAWGHLYKNADSRSFTSMTGLSRDVFQMLMDLDQHGPFIVLVDLTHSHQVQSLEYDDSETFVLDFWHDSCCLLPLP